ncbi:MAG: tetratricopeptide repeat protein [Planctomycetes bacterium]|nr:tetratricopeptide repeat protein [Planctomycetota bacterium]
MANKKAISTRFDKYIAVDPKSAAGVIHSFQIGLSRAVLEANPRHVEALATLGAALSAAGRHEEALEADLKVTAILQNDPIAFYNLACAYANLKRMDEAVEALGKAVDLGYRDFAYLLKDPDLKHVRRDPRFRELLRRKWGRRQP